MSGQDNRFSGTEGAPAEAVGPSAGNSIEPELSGRRSFFLLLTSIGAAAVGALLSVPLVAYMLHPLLKETTETDWADAGSDVDLSSVTAPVERVLTIQNRDAWRVVTAKEPVYVLPPDAGPHRVLSAVCPHLGCKVNWTADKKHFVCPCHDSFFAPDGARMSGPAPRGLDYLESRSEGGRLMVLYKYFRQLVPTRQAIE